MEACAIAHHWGRAIGALRACLMFLKDANDRFVCQSCPIHRPSSRWAGLQSQMEEKSVVGQRQPALFSPVQERTTGSRALLSQCGQLSYFFVEHDASFKMRPILTCLSPICVFQEQAEDDRTYDPYGPTPAKHHNRPRRRPFWTRRHQPLLSVLRRGPADAHEPIQWQGLSDALR